MSRLAKRHIKVSEQITINQVAGKVTVSCGSARVDIDWLDDVTIVREQGAVRLDGGESRTMGLCWSLLNGAVHGVQKPYEKELEIVGVGFQAVVQKNTVVLSVGFANRVELSIPEGVNVRCAEPTRISVSGASRQAVGDFCASIRRVKPAEPYKGKGIRYLGEYVRRKDGKAFGAK